MLVSGKRNDPFRSAFKGEPNRQHILGLIDRNEITTTITTGCCFRSGRKLYRIEEEEEEEEEEESLQLLQVQAAEGLFFVCFCLFLFCFLETD